MKPITLLIRRSGGGQYFFWNPVGRFYTDAKAKGEGR